MTGAPDAVRYIAGRSVLDVPDNPVDPAYFTVVGMGERGENCGIRMATGYSLHPKGSSIRYSHHYCRRATCPSCYSSWAKERAFDIVVTLESYAKVTGERPAALTASVHPDIAKDWSRKDYNIRLHRRGVRRIKQNNGVGGVRAFHPFRIRKDLKPALREAGYGGNQGKGYWRGVHDDALNLVDWRDYVEFGPHDHYIVFPSFLEPNASEDFVIKKYDTLREMSNTVAHVVYLLSHVGKVEGTGDKPTSMWGIFSGREPWDPLDHMTIEELTEIRCRVAELLGRRWDSDTESLEFLEPEDDGVDWQPMDTLRDAVADVLDNPVEYDWMDDGELDFWRRLVFEFYLPVYEVDGERLAEPEPPPPPLASHVEAMRLHYADGQVSPYYYPPLLDEEMDTFDAEVDEYLEMIG